MGLPDPKPQFSYLVSQLRNYNLAYLHVIEPGIAGVADGDAPLGSSNDFLREIWCEEGKDRIFISAGGYTRQTAIERAEAKGSMVAFGRLFIPNVSPLQLSCSSRSFVLTSSPSRSNTHTFSQQPDLPIRLKYDLPLAKPDPVTFYMFGDHTPAGYIDFPVSGALIEGRA